MTRLEQFLKNDLGYEDYEMQIIMEDITHISENSRTQLEKAINGDDVNDYSEGEYSVGKLMKEKGFNIVVAILCIDNLKKDYTKYDALYKRPIK